MNICWTKLLNWPPVSLVFFTNFVSKFPCEMVNEFHRYFTGRFTVKEFPTLMVQEFPPSDSWVFPTPWVEFWFELPKLIFSLWDDGGSHKSQVSQIIIAVVQIRKSPPPLPPPPALPKVESISFFPHFCRFFPPRPIHNIHEGVLLLLLCDSSITWHKWPTDNAQGVC